MGDMFALKKCDLIDIYIGSLIRPLKQVIFNLCDASTVDDSDGTFPNL